MVVGGYGGGSGWEREEGKNGWGKKKERRDCGQACKIANHQ